MFLDLHEIASPVAVIGRRYSSARTVKIFVIHYRRYPDGRRAHALEIGDLLLNSRQVAAPVGLPILVGRVKQPRTAWGIVIGGVAVAKAIGHNLVDHLFLEVLAAQ